MNGAAGVTVQRGPNTRGTHSHQPPQRGSPHCSLFSLLSQLMMSRPNNSRKPSFYLTTTKKNGSITITVNELRIVRKVVQNRCKTTEYNEERGWSLNSMTSQKFLLWLEKWDRNWGGGMDSIKYYESLRNDCDD